ncbi:MAG: SAM-dependent chlorinase/fluorinase [Bryobacterales bacterium]|nr:SAM-dependent chlorinase/fluorinase [Bryobacterales bacterium]
MPKTPNRQTQPAPSVTQSGASTSVTASSAAPPIISLITDFGLSDPYAGLMEAVILGRCHHARVVHLTHEIRPFAIPEAGFALHQSRVELADAVGRALLGVRRALLVNALGHWFVGPDNGVFSMLFREAARLAKAKTRPGQPTRPGYTVRSVENPKWMLPHPSSTFHGRDVFAPVAAHLAAGRRPDSAGPKIEDALRQDWDLPVRTGKRFWNGAVLKVDHFGNLITNFTTNDFPWEPGSLEMQAGMESIAAIRACYADAAEGEFFLIRGSAGFWEISRNQGSAAKALGLTSGSPLEVTLLR